MTQIFTKTQRRVKKTRENPQDPRHPRSITPRYTKVKIVCIKPFQEEMRITQDNGYCSFDTYLPNKLPKCSNLGCGIWFEGRILKQHKA